MSACHLVSKPANTFPACPYVICQLVSKSVNHISTCQLIMCQYIIISTFHFPLCQPFISQLLTFQDVTSHKSQCHISPYHFIICHYVTSPQVNESVNHFHNVMSSSCHVSLFSISFVTISGIISHISTSNFSASQFLTYLFISLSHLTLRQEK